MLSVTHGVLTVAAVGGAGVTGSGTGTVTITGTLAEINATLGAAVLPLAVMVSVSGANTPYPAP